MKRIEVARTIPEERRRWVYTIRRLLRVPPMLLAITIVAFMMLGSGPVPLLEFQPFEDASKQPALTEADRALIMQYLGIHPPVWVDYLRWLGVVPQEDGRFSGVLEGDLGESLWGDETYH